MWNILVLLVALAGLGAVGATPILTWQHPCKNGTSCTPYTANVTVCYGSRTYNWCDFETLACSGKLANYSTVHHPIDPACTVAIVIGEPPVHTTHKYTTTTHKPLSLFESNFFSEAIHGIDDLLKSANATGHSIDEMKKIFSVQDHNHKRYVRNTACWAYPLDLTSISPWNSNHAGRKAGTLITPRHVLWARHYSIPVNATIRFIDRHNNVVDRVITRTKAVPVNGSHYQSYSDIVIGELQDDVPSSISFAKVMPKTVATIRPPSDMRIPAFDTDFEEKALVADFGYESGFRASLNYPHDPLRQALYEPKITGDSGNPVFLVVNDELVLMFVFTYGGAGSGTSVTSHYDDINHIIHDWGSSYRLTDVDLTHFFQIPSVIG